MDDYFKDLFAPQTPPRIERNQGEITFEMEDGTVLIGEPSLIASFLKMLEVSKDMKF